MNIPSDKVFSNKMNRTPIEQARFIQRTLGTVVAAKYLRNRNWSIEAALFILT